MNLTSLINSSLEIMYCSTTLSNHDLISLKNSPSPCYIATGGESAHPFYLRAQCSPHRNQQRNQLQAHSVTEPPTNHKDEIRCRSHAGSDNLCWKEKDRWGLYSGSLMNALERRTATRRQGLWSRTCTSAHARCPAFQGIQTRKVTSDNVSAKRTNQEINWRERSVW